MTSPAVLTRVEGAVGVLTFNRPDSLNTLDVPMLLAIEESLHRLRNDPAVQAIVLTGADGRAFMAGGDIKDLEKRRSLQHYEEFGDVVRRVFRAIETCEQPTIAAVNGWALGGGMELMLCTDLRFLAETARIGLPEIKLGLFPGGGGSQRLMRQLPPCQAKLLMFTGHPIDAQQALALGLVNAVSPPERLMADVMKIAAEIAARPRVALRMLKRAMVYGADMPLDAALEYERAMISLVFESDDAHEGCSAFAQKRPARFTGH